MYLYFLNFLSGIIQTCCSIFEHVWNYTVQIFLVSSHSLKYLVQQVNYIDLVLLSSRCSSVSPCLNSFKNETLSCNQNCNLEAGGCTTHTHLWYTDQIQHVIKQASGHFLVHLLQVARLYQLIYKLYQHPFCLIKIYYYLRFFEVLKFYCLVKLMTTM